MRRHVSFLALVGLVTLLSPRLVLGQPRDLALSTVTHELMSPFCPGLLLADCRSDGARHLRAEIGRRLVESEDPDRNGPANDDRGLRERIDDALADLD